MKRHANKGQQGGALLSVMMLTLTVSALLGTMVNASLQRSFVAQKLAQRVKAKAYAEAGAEYAYSILMTNFALRSEEGSFPKVEYKDGTYALTVTPVGDDIAVVSSKGSFGSVEVEVIFDVMDLTPAAESEDEDSVGGTAYNYAMLCGGEFRFLGCGSISAADGQPRLHANGKLTVSGNAQADIDIESSTEVQVKNVTVQGDVTAPVLDVHGQAVITGSESAQPVPVVTIPDIDLTPYYNWANDHGEVHNGFTLVGGTYSPDGGVIWVNGDVHISDNALINGSIIATGEIHLSGDTDIIPTVCAIAIATRDGPEIRNQSSGTIEGLIYAKSGDYIHTANGRVEGQIIIQGDIRKGGNSDVLLFSQSVPAPPSDSGGGDGTAELVVAVTAWQK